MPTATKAEILLYSGRRNPTVPLPPALAARLIRDVAGLRRGAAAPDPPGLGYAGVRVTGLPDGSVLLVAPRTVTVERAGEPALHLADPDRTIERMLLDAAIDGLPGDQADLADYLRTLRDGGTAP